MTNRIQVPSGFRDFLNEEAQLRLDLIREIAAVYRLHGFFPLETPALENVSFLLGGQGGEENEKLIFKVLKRGEKFIESFEHLRFQPPGPLVAGENELADFGLRFDLTVPLARVVASHRGEIRFPWKVFHIGPVWRAERPQKGRFREFIQCDVDIVGAPHGGAEVEVIQAAVQALATVGGAITQEFELRINDRRLIQKMSESLGFPPEYFSSFAILLDKKDKLSPEKWLQQWEQLRQTAGVQPLEDPFHLSLLEALIQGEMELSQVKGIHEQACTELETLLAHLAALELPLARFVFDPSLVRGMGYYTGPVFELRHPAEGYAFAGGGRYDDLIGRFLGEPIAACGMSIGFERLLLLLKEKKTSLAQTDLGVFMPVLDESCRSLVGQLAQKLRKHGIPVDVYPAQAKLKNQLKFASDSGYRWVILAGQEEFASGKMKLKDFHLGTEEALAEVSLLQKLDFSQKLGGSSHV